MSRYKYEAGGIIIDTEMDNFPYHTDNIVEFLEEKDDKIAQLEEQLNSAEVGERFALKCCEEATEQLKNAIILPKGLEIGCNIYYVCENCDTNKYYIEYGKVYSITKELNYEEDGFNVWIYCRYKSGLTFTHLIKDYGVELFATKKEAQEKIKELEGK